MTKNQKTVVLWYLEGCIATFYELQDDGKKIPIDTVCFRDKAYLAFRQVDILVRASYGWETVRANYPPHRESPRQQYSS